MGIVPAVRCLLLGIVMLALSVSSIGQVGISITFGPPALPVYEQPPCPAEGYIWTPGYWAYDPDYDDYYWVPGTWIEAPEVGYLWTPGYWAWGGEGFVFHDGYWGPHVGFYGGIAYGYGYFGEGYEGGRWDNGRFFYNRSVTNVNVTNIRNVYNTTVVNSTTVNRVSYNGGNGGLAAHPSPEDEVAARDRHLPPVAVQTQHTQAARSTPELRASANYGKPPVAATPKPGALKDHEVVAAREAGAPYNSPPNRGSARPAADSAGARPENKVPSAANNAPRPENGVPRPPTAVHPRDLPPHPRPAPPNTGNSRQDQKYQQQQEKLYNKQEQDHQKLQQKQEQDHQRLEQQNADEARKQQAEQSHQQQTQQMEQKHAQQQQHLQDKQPPVRPNQPRPPN
jgi:WXXGXW repeat (2 copies)